MNHNQLSHRIIINIKSSIWFEPYYIDFLNLHECRKPHEIIERIFLNVSARINKPWKEVYHASVNNPDVFSELCVALILVQRALKDHLKMSENETTSILGGKFSNILELCNYELNKI